MRVSLGTRVLSSPPHFSKALEDLRRERFIATSVMKGTLIRWEKFVHWLCLGLGNPRHKYQLWKGLGITKSSWQVESVVTELPH